MIQITYFDTSYAVIVFFMLLIDILLVYRLTKTSGFGKSERWILLLLGAAVICASSDALSVHVGNRAGYWPAYILNALFDLSTECIGFFFFYYCETIYEAKTFTKKAMVILLSASIILLTIALITSHWTGWIFSIDAQGNYVRGPFYIFFVFIIANGYTLGEMLLCIFRLWKETNKEKRKILRASLCYVVPLVIGTYTQFFLPQLPTSNMGLTITMLLIFMNNQERLLNKQIYDAKRANQAKSDFLARMSHDIRTPINGILGMIEISDQNRDNKELLDKNRQKEKDAAQYLLSLINDILSMSKLESDTIELESVPFDMKELLNSISGIHEVLAAEKGQQFQQICELKEEHRYVIGSPSHVRSILVNIAGNAIKYTSAGGKITMKCEEMCMEEEIIALKFVISDTGIGMSEEFLSHIFEPFTQEHKNAGTVCQGTGLGMSIVKKLVDKMGGTIDIESKVSEGSTFTVILPFKIAASPVGKTEEAKEDVVSIKGMNVLVVEDNEMNLEIVQYFLENAQTKVYTARNGKEAVEQFENSEIHQFDAILMDVMMPVLDGLTATTMIRNLKRKDAKTIPIIAMTANAFVEDIEQCKKAGMNEHLAKPLDYEKLMEVLRKYVKEG